MNKIKSILFSLVLTSSFVAPVFATVQEELSVLVTEGVSLSLRGEYGKAIELFNQALKLSPNNIWILKPRAAAYRKSGNNEKAIEDYNKIIELADSAAEKHYRAGKMHWAYQRHQQALLELNEAIDLEPLQDQYFVSRGTIKCNLGLFKDAIEDYSLAIKLSPDSKHAYHMRALAYRKINNEAKAMQDEKKAESLKLNNDIN